MYDFELTFYIQNERFAFLLIKTLKGIYSSYLVVIAVVLSKAFRNDEVRNSNRYIVVIYR